MVVCLPPLWGTQAMDVDVPMVTSWRETSSAQEVLPWRSPLETLEPLSLETMMHHHHHHHHHLSLR